jgi:hypothetical protein
MQTGTASTDGFIGPGILDKIAHVFSRIIGVPGVVERFLGDYRTSVWEKQNQ